MAWDLAHLWAFCTQGHIRDITDSLIEHCQDKKLDENANIQLSDEKIVSVVLDLFGAGMRYPICLSYTQLPYPINHQTSPSVLFWPGFDTVTTAISWSLMYLVTSPGVQKKIQQELGRW